MSYFKKLQDTVIKANKVALQNKNGKAWDNKKTKNRGRYCPRGKAFKRMEQLDRTTDWNAIIEPIQSHPLFEEVKAKLESGELVAS